MEHSGSGPDRRFQASPGVSLAPLCGASSFCGSPVTLPYFPHQGEILICDFDDAAPGAEMVKRRPVIVVSRHETHHRRLCTVVPLSTTSPTPQRNWHHPLPHLQVTGWQANGPMWAKCDMLVTVSFERLNKPYVKTRSGRQHVTHKLDAADMSAVLSCLRAYFGI